MNEAGDWAGWTGGHARAAYRGGVFALCTICVVAILWASTGSQPLADFSSVGRGALAQARSIVAAPALASTPFINSGQFGRGIEGGLR